MLYIEMWTENIENVIALNTLSHLIFFFKFQFQFIYSER